MKILFIALSLLATKTAFAQSEHLNKYLHDNSKCYMLAVAQFLMYDYKKDVTGDGFNGTVGYYEDAHPEKVKSFSAYLTPQNSEYKEFKTIIYIELSDNLAISLCVVTKSSNDSAEVTILKKVSGEYYDCDYGLIKMLKKWSDKNQFLQEAQLQNNSSVVVKDRNTVKTFKVIGIPFKGTFIMPEYDFTK